MLYKPYDHYMCVSIWIQQKYLIVQAPFAPADHELIVNSTASVTPSAPVAPLNVTTDDARKAELQALVHVGLYLK